MSTMQKSLSWLSFYKPPFWYDPESGGYIFDREGNLVIEVRGWGHLCSQLEDSIASKVQDKMGYEIAELLNNSIIQ